MDIIIPIIRQYGTFKEQNSVHNVADLDHFYPRIIPRENRPGSGHYLVIFRFNEVTSLISLPEVGILNSSPQLRNTAYIPIDCGSAD